MGGVAAARLIVFSMGADRIQLKSSMGIPEMYQKGEPRTPARVSNSAPVRGNVLTSFYMDSSFFFKIVAFKRTIRKILITLAAEAQGNPSYAYLTHFFRVMSLQFNTGPKAMCGLVAIPTLLVIMSL
jgi:hypothetical protein